MTLRDALCECYVCVCVYVRPIVHASKKKTVFVCVCCVCVCCGDHLFEIVMVLPLWMPRLQTYCEFCVFECVFVLV